MKKSIFSASKLSNLNVVAKGTKTTNDARPEVVTGRAINKFTMNASAAALLDVDNGDNVVMFYIPDAESLDEKFFIAKGTAKDAKLASSNKTIGVPKVLNFSYSSLWSLMIQEDLDAQPLGERALVEKGIMKYVPTQMGRDKGDGKKEMCYANLVPYQLAYEVELVTDENGVAIPVTVGDTTYERVFVLKNVIKRYPDENKKEAIKNKDVENEVEDNNVETEDIDIPVNSKSDIENLL